MKVLTISPQNFHWQLVAYEIKFKFLSLSFQQFYNIDAIFTFLVFIFCYLSSAVYTPG
jgi:hypothetical protein